jgi:hypothetical protein
VILERDPDTVRGPDVALYEDASSFAELHPKYGEVPAPAGRRSVIANGSPRACDGKNRGLPAQQGPPGLGRRF